MARRTQSYTVTDEGRDLGKVFVITEMPASQAERWAMRALMALAQSGLDLPDDVQAMGMAGVAALGFQALAGIDFEKAEPLLQEMFECVKVVPDPSRTEVVRSLIETDVEEVVTRLKLRKEIFSLHVDFFTNASRSTSQKVASPTAG